MEYYRGFLCVMIQFYFTLELKDITSLDDVVRLWTQKFQIREVKTVLSCIPQIYKTRGLNPADPRDKDKALKAIAQVIRRYQYKFDECFKNTGTDSTQCDRALVPLNIDLNHINESLSRFVQAFDDLEKCRSRCSIDTFLLNRHESNIRKYLDEALNPKLKSNASGYIKLTKILEHVTHEGQKSCSCKQCEKIGDAIIALDADRQMQLEHTDTMYNFLCPPISQPHFHHPSELALSNMLAKKRTEISAETPS